MMVNADRVTACPRKPSRHPACSLLDDMVRPRDGGIVRQGLGGLEIDHQLELRGLLHGQLAGLGALEDLVDARRSVPRL